MMHARAKRRSAKARPPAGRLLAAWRWAALDPATALMFFEGLLMSRPPGGVLTAEARAVMREIAAKGQGP